MVVCSRRTAPLTTITACSLGMAGVIETLVHNTILHRDEMAVIGIHILLSGPTKLAVVNDIIAAILCAEGVLGNDFAIDVIMPNTETDISDDEVLRAATVDLVVADDDTHARCRLAGNRVVLAIDTQVLDQTYLSAHGKAHRQRFIGKLLHRPTQAALGSSVRIVRQRRHIHDLTATASTGVLAKTFGSGKSEKRIRKQSGIGN